MIAGGIAQEVDCLPSKHKALSSNTNTIKKKEKYVWKRGHEILI
jgi:hypothetical protein